MIVHGMDEETYKSEKRQLNVHSDMFNNMSSLLNEYEVENCYLIISKPFLWTESISLFIQFTAPTPREKMLKILMEIGNKIGIHKFNRLFEDTTGSFMLSGETQMELQGHTYTVALHLPNIDSPKCKITRVVEMVERYHYEADCHEEEVNLDSVADSTDT